LFVFDPSSLEIYVLRGSAPAQFLTERRYLMKMSLLERGQGMVEYAFILMLVAIVVIAAITLLGPAVGRMFSSVSASL
jgi:pilus assembly protein Flp/PilA